MCRAERTPSRGQEGWWSDCNKLKEARLVPDVPPRLDAWSGYILARSMPSLLPPSLGPSQVSRYLSSLSPSRATGALGDPLLGTFRPMECEVRTP